MQKILIIGGGQAAGQVVTELVKREFAGKLTIVCAEPHPPYQRPPLSKQYLQGTLPPERLLVKPRDWYQQNAVELLLNETARVIDRKRKTVALASGTELAYDKLVLTTGARVIELGIPGKDLQGVHYLRSANDSDNLRSAMRPGQRLGVIGGGYIGLEVAAVAATAGLQVEVVEMAERILNRVTSPFISNFFTRVHNERGVRIHTDCRVEGLLGNTRVSALQTSTGTIKVDLVVTGIGIRPCTELAEQADLPCDNGIVVDEYCRTADHDILAAGDCTNHPNPLLGQRLRLESVQNALEQGRSVATTIAGESSPYSVVPWFWSDQYDVKLQMLGLVQNYDQTVLRGNPDENDFLHLYLRAGRMVAAEAINRPREFMALRKLAPEQPRVDIAQLRDPTVAITDAVVV